MSDEKAEEKITCPVCKEEIDFSAGNHLKDPLQSGEAISHFACPNCGVNIHLDYRDEEGWSETYSGESESSPQVFKPTDMMEELEELNKSIWEDFSEVLKGEEGIRMTETKDGNLKITVNENSDVEIIEKEEESKKEFIFRTENDEGILPF